MAELREAESAPSKEKPKWLVACLGNPGKEYAKTRHNLGFMVAEALAEHFSVSFNKEKKASVAKASIDSETVHLMQPLTYMNLSGQAVRDFMSYHKISTGRLLVVVDDIDLPFSEMKLKLQGSSGGHNGLKSIEQSLGTAHFARLKMGIGYAAPLSDQIDRKLRPSGDQLADYVLAPFTKIEQEQLPLFVDAGAKAVLHVLKVGLQQAMSEINRKKV
ncbi:MAG: pth [Chlamydiales bacterium]|jgi:PTH1 family peptidyl-tRNA hydrolase|nr:pth [Chlamydiales bacterium]